MEHSIHNKSMCVTATEAGAELLRVTAFGKERLWQNETGVWAGHAPNLFPFCGNCEMKLDGVSYGRGFHGFASRKRFFCVAAADTSMTFRLTDDAETERTYPFRFSLDVIYSLPADDLLEIRWEITNESDRPMPFACGGHESYALPGAVDGFQIVFPQKEQLLLLIHDSEGRLSGKTEDRGIGNVLPLSSADLSGGNTLILGNLRSDSVILADKRDNRPFAESVFPGFSNLLLWRPDGADMICIEPWMNLPDDACGCPDFAKKPGVRILPPHEKRCLTRQIRYYDF